MTSPRASIGASGTYVPYHTYSLPKYLSVYTGSPLQTTFYASTVHKKYHGLSLEGDREKQLNLQSDTAPSNRSFEVQNIKRTPRNYSLQRTENPYFQYQNSLGAPHLSQSPPAVTVLLYRMASSLRKQSTQTTPHARTKP